MGPAAAFSRSRTTILHEGTRQQAEFLNRLQQIALEKTRLGIPLLETEEGTHGLMAPGSNDLSRGALAQGSTWNIDLIGRVYAAVAKEARAIGVHQNFTLVIEPIRDPRLGRNEEAFSEDPFLCSRIARDYRPLDAGHRSLRRTITWYRACVIIPGQSQPASGLERGAMEISERRMRDVFLPSWQAGIKKGGALGVMATYPAIDGVPTHASAETADAHLARRVRLRWAGALRRRRNRHHRL